MKTIKMSLATMQGKMSRKEMKELMAGSDRQGGAYCSVSVNCGGGRIIGYECPTGPGCQCSGNDSVGGWTGYAYCYK